MSRREKLKIARNNNQRINDSVASNEIKVECARCRRFLPLDILEIHHKKAKSEGGSDRIDNLALLCSTCNRKVGAKKEEKRKKSRSIWDDIF